MARENGVEAMKTARVPCDFCEFCRYDRAPQEPLSMESELRRLRLLRRRMTGRDLDGLSFPELELLRSRLTHVLEIVKTHKAQVEQEERERLQMKQAASKVPCSASGISSGERPEKPATTLERAYERRLAEPMETEFERLWLLNERMNGRKLEGMTLFELSSLECQIRISANRTISHKLEPETEERAKRLKEESISVLVEQDLLEESLDNVKYYHRDFSLRSRSKWEARLSVSRKLRKFQKGHYRKIRSAALRV
ncbi:hypothetical protein AALP_AA1G011900 [Arabis alpina]|uniref:K-box domain-containing protein n=1 Tax=Arabis alpina TaxID=50452 RepID=A0A087HKB4_ARAAL|nr:hypothetical protein AALP_AA1G011900 [Arabis alpina]